jgi:hypothetical protein
MFVDHEVIMSIDQVRESRGLQAAEDTKLPVRYISLCVARAMVIAKC